MKISHREKLYIGKLKIKGIEYKRTGFIPNKMTIGKTEDLAEK